MAIPVTRASILLKLQLCKCDIACILLLTTLWHDNNQLN